MDSRLPEGTARSGPSTPYFDKFQPLETHYTRDLPHWNQDGKMQYVTFRLADSLPQSKIAELKHIIANFERIHPRPWSNEIIRKYWQIIGPIEDKLLDNGYGSCVLKDEENRNLLQSSIFFYDGKKYDVMTFVIMPNHVHLLILLYEGFSLEKVMHSIKSYSANEINKRLDRSGKLWVKENFDRIVRSDAHLEHCFEYIRTNPAYLRPEDFTLYVRGV